MLRINKKSIQKIGMAITLAGFAIGGSLAEFASAPAYAATKNSTISRQEAIDIAQKEVKGTLLKTELDHENGRLVYEIDILHSSNTKYDLDIDASSGKIVRTKKTQYRKQNAEKLRSAKITHNKAIEIAKKDTGASTLLSCELDIENKKLVYEVTLTDGKYTEYELIIDASTGTILFSDTDYDD